jgi:hypothetical protein
MLTSLNSPAKIFMKAFGLEFSHPFPVYATTNLIGKNHTGKIQREIRNYFPSPNVHLMANTKILLYKKRGSNG